MKTPLKRSSVFVLVLALALFCSWFFAVRPAFLGGPVSYVMVVGSSMEPTMSGGDLAIVKQRDDYGIGDIVAFRADGGIVIHRIIDQTPEGYVMQGDNKERIDAWRPTDDNIVGEMWLHLPFMGLVFDALQTPVGFGILTAILVAFAFAGERQVKRRRKASRRRRIERDEIIDYRKYLRQRQNRNQQMSPVLVSGDPAPHPDQGWMPRASSAWLLPALCGLGVLTAIAAVLGFIAFQKPAEASALAESARYEHSVELGYNAEMEMSSLYPSGVATSGTGLAGNEEDPADMDRTPIYTQLARMLQLDFVYSLESALPSDISGTIRAQAHVRVEDGWTKPIAGSEEVEFDGNTASTRLEIDVPDTMSIIDTIEAETGSKASAYEIFVEFGVETEGQIGPETIEDAYSASFPVNLNRTQISFEPVLSQSEARSIRSEDRENQTLNLGLVSPPVELVRVMAILVLVPGLVLTATLAAVIFLGVGRSPFAKVQARYGGMIVPVVGIESGQEVQQIQVATFEDLVRIARRDGNLILHMEPQPGQHRYVVTDSLVSYVFELSDGTPNSVSEESRQAA